MTVSVNNWNITLKDATLEEYKVIYPDGTSDYITKNDFVTVFTSFFVT